MKLFWAPLLLCGLLPISQSTEGTSGSATVNLSTEDLEVLQKRLQEEVAKTNPMKGLVGISLGGLLNIGGLQICSKTGGLLGGILGGGQNSLLEKLVGGSGTGLLCSILEGEIIGLDVSPISLQLIDKKLMLSFGVNLAVKATGLTDVNVNLSIILALQVLPNEKGALVAKVEDCKIQVKVNLELLPGLLPSINNALNELLGNTLQNPICPSLSGVVIDLNKLLADLHNNGQAPGGNPGSGTDNMASPSADQNA